MSAFEQVYEKTGKMPTALRKRPKIAPHLLEYWNGFVALDRSRVFIMGIPSGIQYGEILAYATIQGFIGEDMIDFTRFVSALDDHFLDWWKTKHGKT